MFGPLGGRRPRRRVPGWLLLLALGVLAGAGGVVAVQERYLPPRLSAAETAQLRRSFEQADGERQRLQDELAQSRQQLQAVTAANERLGAELATLRAGAARLRDDLASVVRSLPPDPRGGTVEVRAAQFSARPGTLDYEVVLSREGSAHKPLDGLVQLSIAGESAQGVPATLAPKPIALTLQGHEVVRGSLQLPDGFKPRQTTVQVLDRAAGKALGMRVLLVR